MPSEAPGGISRQVLKQTALQGPHPAPRLREEHRVPCPRPSQQHIDPTLGKNRYWRGQEKDLLRHVCRSRCLQMYSHSLCFPTAAAHSSQSTCRGQSRVWGLGTVKCQGQRDLRGPGQLPTAQLKPRGECPAQGHVAGVGQGQAMNSGLRMAFPRPHTWATLCTYDQFRRPPSFPTDNVSACP